MGDRRKDAIGQSKCILSRLFSYFDKLDEIGVYDSSLIFVVGDHGNSNVTVDTDLATPPIPESMRPSASMQNDPRKKKGIRTSRSVPLFLVKRPRERNSLAVSDDPVSLCDVPSSIFSVLEIEQDFQCESIFGLSGGRRTPRFHYEYSGPNRDKGPTYEFTEYQVDRHSWYPSSWRLSNENDQ